MYFGTLTNHGIRTESAAGTFELGAGVDGFTKVGMPVSITGNNTVDLSADGAEIFGLLESYEDRGVEGATTGAVSWQVVTTFDYTGTAPAAGGRIVGAGAGAVKAAGTGAGMNTLVLSVNTTDSTVEVLIR